MNKHILEKIALVTGGILVGSGVTYLVVNKQLNLKYSDMLQTEMDSAREDFKRLYKVFPYNEPEAVLDEPVIYNELATGETEVVDQILEDEGYSTVEIDLTAITTNETVEEFEEKHHISEVLRRAQENMNQSVIVNPPSQAQRVLSLEEVTASPSDISKLGGGNIFDKLVEPNPLELRDTNFPYIISIQEWSTTHQDDYNKTTLTYYTGGKKPELADDNGHLLPNLKYLIGTDAGRHFGYDPENPQTVFVRNESLKADFEVILDTRSYAEAELGIDPGD